ncbi:MAG: uroporphyrinogen-III synthase [Muribaculaceae bacterium]|nr:uroporphyrinogen-III synthase [Muribaculaceae bacterium]
MIKKILVSQPQPAAGKNPYFDIAQKFGVEVVFRSMIKVEGLTGKEFRQERINLADYTAIIFTSRTAVDHYFRLCEESRVQVPDTMRYVCTSEQIAHYLQKYIVYRKRKIAFGTTGKLSDPQFIAAVTKIKKEKFLMPVSDVNKEDSSQLESTGIDLTKAVMFRTLTNDFTPDEPFDYDILLFFSPSGIKSLKKNFPDFDQEVNGKYIGTFGPTTAKAVEEAGLRLDFSAPTPENPSMTSALEKFLEERMKEDAPGK